MGSKAMMLQNGLGDMLKREAGRAERFVDLFAGSGTVAAFVAERVAIPTIAVDLQEYSSHFAGAITARTSPVELEELKENWLEPAKTAVRRHRLYARALKIEQSKRLPQKATEARALCSSAGKNLPIWSAYGGYYFSPLQALTIDILRRKIPRRAPLRQVTLAALMIAASRCAASPGHTAQPFRPVGRTARFVHEAWSRDVLHVTTRALQGLVSRHARVKGFSATADATTFARSINAGDLVFLDPPYSSVQYSRFYHVLEAIARGNVARVQGNGRYPPLSERPQSEFCNFGTSQAALSELLGIIASRQARAILTFPEKGCSNGLSGTFVAKEARRHFHVRLRRVHSRFSTLGGSNRNRPARQGTTELIMLLNPKRVRPSGT